MHMIPILILAALAASCGSKTEELPPAAQQNPLIPAPPAAPPAAPQAPKRTPDFHFEDAQKIPNAALAEYHVTMKVEVNGAEAGTIVFALWPEKAPNTVRNFLRYCDEGFYDGLLFHRILRDFMIQGGSPTNDGAGNGPNGKVKGEFSMDPRWFHRYGVLSMARGNDPDSASSQFFLCCEESDSTAGLNGMYTSFGRMVSGVAALEAIANVPTGANPQSGEASRPLKKALILEARVVAGAAPAPTEKIARPAPTNDAPTVIEVQHILISFKGIPRVNASRSQAEAETLAQELLGRAQKGEDFTALVKEFSDDGKDPTDPTPGVYRMTEAGFTDPLIFAGMEQRMAGMNTVLAPLEAKVRAGEANNQVWVAEVKKGYGPANLGKFLQETISMPRADMAPAFGNVGFALKVGEIGLAPYDKTTSPFGIHIIKRLQ
jgi:peptidyl-prolyl cis-trans isomerase B (cyclophilin B)